MTVPKFTSGEDLFEYVVSQGPALAPDVIEYLRGDEPADGIYDYFIKARRAAPDVPLDEMKAVVRANIKLVSGDEAAFQLADFVAAPWDCFV